MKQSLELLKSKQRRYGDDLNQVPKFEGKPPMNPASRAYREQFLRKPNKQVQNNTQTVQSKLKLLKVAKNDNF